uniref:RING-type domain-containing protein n=1 Tax=Oryza glaberrima TaxID=4538 RepID=I1QFP2_ORYGL
MTGAAAWPVCTICYEDLRPLSDQHLHCLPACGHVFHALCLEQWLEYCPGGKKKLTCPICKQPCGAAHPPTRLFFQSTGACPTQTASSSPSRHEPTDGGADREELAAEVARLEQKAASLGRVLDEQRDGIQKLNAEVAMWREKAAEAEVMKESVRREKECVQHLLNAKTEELSRKTSECGRLQEKGLSLAKELAALKLSTDMNLQEEEILKLASLGNHGNAANAVDVLTRSLALRNKSYKELMIQCNVLGRSESRSQQRFEKAKELIKKLKARVQDLEKEQEEKENGVIRDLRSAKKFKADQTNSGNTTVNNGFSGLAAGCGDYPMKLDEVMHDPCDKPGPSPEAKNDLNIKDKMDDKHADVIDLDADDSVFQHEHKKGLSAKPFGNDGNDLDFKSRSSLQERYRKESISCKTYVAEENSFLKPSMVTERSALQESFTTNKLQSFQETPVVRSMKATTSTWEKETLTIDGISKQATRMAPGTGPQQVHNFNSLSDDFQIPIRNLGGEGTGKSVGKWCKGVATPGSLNTNANKRNLIAVGPDGRGGKVKILRDLGKFQDSKTQALWPKAQKVGSRGGQSQIDHFFGKR